MLGLCLVAALALGAYAVSSASALEWGKCEFAGPGHLYAGSNCTKAEKASPKGTGEYEWRKASEVSEKRVAEGKSAGVPFTGHSVGSGGVLAATLRICEEYSGHTILGTREECEALSPGWEEWEITEGAEYGAIECENETNEGGHTEGKNKVAGVTVRFTGCLYLGAIVCASAGAEPGEIVTSKLKGKLGWLNKSVKEVGVVLEPEQKHGLFAFFICNGAEFKVGVGNKKEGTNFVSGTKYPYPEGCSGSHCPGATPEEEKHGGYDQIISPITPVNQMTNEFTQVYTRENGYPFGNIPRNFENKHLSALELKEEEPGNGAIQWSAASEEITNVNIPEEEGEIKA